MTAHPEKVLVYFGAIGGSGSYLAHKNNMKSIIMDEAQRYIILNLSQVVGRGGNGNNLFNSFKESLRRGEEIKCYRDCLRSLIDIDDVMYLLNNLIYTENYGIHNFYGIEPLPVDLIIQLMAEALEVTARIKISEGSYVKIDNSDSVKRLVINDINKYCYTKGLINKYI